VAILYTEPLLRHQPKSAFIIGSDAYRFEGVRKCSCKPVRQDYLDKVVWDQVIGLLEDPSLIQREVEKRIEETRKTSPVVHQRAAIEKQRTKLTQSMDKLLDAYQEGLIPISQLRKRMPELPITPGTLRRHCLYSNKPPYTRPVRTVV
jgi:site-specific DNA recombinase